MTNLAKVDETTAVRISHYQRIIAFRNVLMHGYADIDDRLVWDVLETDLSTLSHEVTDLLKEAESS